MKKEPFGYQLVVDLYDCRPGYCDDLSLCYDFLDTIVDFLDMEKQSPPSIFRSDGRKYPDKSGLSGWVPLIESSVVIHTLSPKNYISVDVYSCKEYDPDKTVEWITNYFDSKRVESQFWERGITYNEA